MEKDPELSWVKTLPGIYNCLTVKISTEDGSFFPEKIMLMIIINLYQSIYVNHNCSCWSFDLYQNFDFSFPQNLLFVDDSDDAELKVVDFGFARLKGSQPLQTPCFTLSYAAPEILKHATQEVIDGYDEAYPQQRASRYSGSGHTWL